MSSIASSELPGLVEAPVARPSFKPADSRKNPVVWVKTLAAHSEWPPSKITLLRRIDLRRGLNILWAQPSNASSDGTKLSGHGAGKSTFCRFIRYVLNDATYGTKELREALTDTERNGFRNAWVLAEIIVAGEQWLVGRPLGHVGYQSFAKKGGKVDDTYSETPPNTGYNDYCDAIDVAVFGEMKLRDLSGSGDRLEWQGLLGWLARDQEAHYSGLLEWRHSDSDHGTTVLSAADRENAVRLVLGLIKSKEQELLREHAKTAGAHEEGTRVEKPKIDFWVKRSRQHLESLIGRAVPDPKDALLQKEIEDLVAAEEKKADAAVASSGFDKEIDRLSDVIATREADWRFARTMLLGVIGKLPKEQRDLEAARQEASDAEQSAAIRVMHPFKDYCSQPLGRAWRERCPLADDRPTDDQVEDLLKKTTTHAKILQEKNAALVAAVKAHEKVVAEKLAALSQARSDLRAARGRRDAKLGELNAPRKLASEITAAFEDYKRAAADWNTLLRRLAALDAEKTKLDGRLRAFTEQHEALVRTISAIFNHIVQTSMGSNLIGNVEFSGKGIEPRVRDHARRNSPAIKVAKFLAFDITALVLSMTTVEGHHPRLLIHDSPRESDLDAEIYRGLFRAVQEMEDGENSAFQYIVTTTEAPPDELNRRPWRLEPVLNAREAKTRFLGIDL